MLAPQQDDGFNCRPLSASACLISCRRTANLQHVGHCVTRLTQHNLDFDHPAPLRRAPRCSTADEARNAVSTPWPETASRLHHSLTSWHDLFDETLHLVSFRDHQHSAILTPMMVTAKEEEPQACQAYMLRAQVEHSVKPMQKAFNQTLST